MVKKAQPKRGKEPLSRASLPRIPMPWDPKKVQPKRRQVTVWEGGVGPGIEKQIYIRGRRYYLYRIFRRRKSALSEIKKLRAKGIGAYNLQGKIGKVVVDNAIYTDVWLKI